MRCLEGLPAPGSFPPPSAVTVGVFDGIHLGHHALLERTLACARELGGSAIVFTFREHPEVRLRGSAPPALQTVDERLRLIADRGFDGVVLADFTAELREMSPEEFHERVLLEGLGCRKLVLGFDSAICRGRSGTAEKFRQLGLDAERVDPVEIGGIAVSSSAIRQALSDGDMSLAATLLGRHYAVSGIVTRGAARGRDIGFPTANLLPPDRCLPASGVYAVRVTVGDREFDGVANLGTRPTFVENDAVQLEVHLLDFERDLYGQRIEVSFEHRIRGERRFSGADELRSQIERDIADARRLLRPTA